MRLIEEDDENWTCLCNECMEYGWHGSAPKGEKKETWRYTMDSCLLTGTSRFGTMALFDLTKEYYDPKTEKVTWAEIVFSINQFWIWKRLFNNKRTIEDIIRKVTNYEYE